MTKTSEVDLLSVHLGAVRVGSLYRLPDDRITFAFDPGYQELSTHPTLSLGFKSSDGGLVTPGMTRTRLLPYFANLLPEGRLREYIAERLGVKAVRDFPLIGALGGDLPGNVRVVEEGRGPTTDSIALTGSSTNRPLKFSLAGVQLKFSVVESASGGLSLPMSGIGGDWIVKLPSLEYQGVPTHEFAMLELARSIGLEVPQTRMVDLEAIEGLPREIRWVEKQALAVRRFDRSDGERIHTEDFAQVFGVYPEQKYRKASNESIARVILAECGVDEVMHLVRRLVFTVLIGNGDAHLKNWSLIYRDGMVPELSPVYDQVATVLFIPGDRLALSLGGGRNFHEVDLGHFARFANRVGVPVKSVIESVIDTVAAFKLAWRNGVGGDAALSSGQVRQLEEHLEGLALWQA